MLCPSFFAAIIVALASAALLPTVIALSPKQPVRRISGKRLSSRFASSESEFTIHSIPSKTSTAASTVPSAVTSPASTLVPGPPRETKPDYENIIGPLGRTADRLFLIVFRQQLETITGLSSSYAYDDYQGLIDITRQLNQQFPQSVVQQRAQQVLISLFPSWMPGSYAQLFSKPFPNFSARMNAWATRVAGTWLMGECEINDVVVNHKIDDTNEEVNEIGRNQGLLVKRCRFLEESGCASVCVNSCKIPTQNFFWQNMGLPLTMEPNYDTFECQFSFGKMPTEETELAAQRTPCLLRCPSAGSSLRTRHVQQARGRSVNGGGSDTSCVVEGENFSSSSSGDKGEQRSLLTESVIDSCKLMGFYNNSFTVPRI